jgi:GxxExxY protein
MKMNKDQLDMLGSEILDACIAVHKELGPGLLESVYKAALMIEFSLREIPFQEEVRIFVTYKGRQTGKYFDIDLLVCDEIILELKSVKEMVPFFEAKLINHLRLTDKRLGYLVNFNVLRLKDGFQRFVNKLY